MMAWRQAGLILCVSAVPGAFSAAFHPRRPGWTQEALKAGEVRLADVEGWRAAVLWVDARDKGDFDAGHAPAALHLDLLTWPSTFPLFLDRWQPGERVVVYCGASSCHLAEEVAEKLRANGIDSVYVLKGGWEAWKARHPSR
jgi:rhodanese-related sulfurtransferase